MSESRVARCCDICGYEPANLLDRLLHKYLGHDEAGWPSGRDSDWEDYFARLYRTASQKKAKEGESR